MQDRLPTEIHWVHGQLYTPDIVLMLPTVKLAHARIILRICYEQKDCCSYSIFPSLSKHLIQTLFNSVLSIICLRAECV